MYTRVACFLVFLAVAVGQRPGRLPPDMPLSRQKRGFIEDIFSGLSDKFTATVDKVLNLKAEKFEKVVKGVKNVAKGTAKKILGFFKKFVKEHHDLEGDTGFKLHQLMEALEQRESEDNVIASSGNPSVTTSRVVAVVLGVIGIIFTN